MIQGYSCPNKDITCRHIHHARIWSICACSFYSFEGVFGELGLCGIWTDIGIGFNDHLWKRNHIRYSLIYIFGLAIYRITSKLTKPEYLTRPLGKTVMCITLSYMDCYAKTQAFLLPHPTMPCNGCGNLFVG